MIVCNCPDKFSLSFSALPSVYEHPYNMMDLLFLLKESKFVSRFDIAIGRVLVDSIFFISVSQFFIGSVNVLPKKPLPFGK